MTPAEERVSLTVRGNYIDAWKQPNFSNLTMTFSPVPDVAVASCVVGETGLLQSGYKARTCIARSNSWHVSNSRPDVNIIDLSVLMDGGIRSVDQADNETCRSQERAL